MAESETVFGTCLPSGICPARRWPAIPPLGILEGMPQTQQKQHVHGYHADKTVLVKRLHRIEGQVRGIEKMVEDDRYCMEILTQVSAVATALESVALKILDDHVNHCVAGALASGEEAEAEIKTRELLEAVRRFARMR